MMSDPLITCPNCKEEIKLNESLAAPLLEATRIEYEAKLRVKETEFASRETAIKTRESKLSHAQESIDATVAEKLRSERTKIAEDEGRKAKLELGAELERKQADIAVIVTQTLSEGRGLFHAD